MPSLRRYGPRRAIRVTMPEQSRGYQMVTKRHQPKLFERRGDVSIMDRSDPSRFFGKCEVWGKKDELRPYGRNHENICFKCGMKNKKLTRKRFTEMLGGTGH